MPEFYWPALLFLGAFALGIYGIRWILDKYFKGQKDKYLHMGISFMVTPLLFLFFPKNIVSVAVAWVMVILVGGLKELWDKKRSGHTCDIKDFGADVIGATFGAILAGVILFIGGR